MKITKSELLSAASAALTILIISLYLCMIFAGDNGFTKLLPVWFFILGILSELLLRCVKVFKEKPILRIIIGIVLAAGAGIAAAI